jgi:Protein of unknown function (DUF2934)
MKVRIARYSNRIIMFDPQSSEFASQIVAATTAVLTACILAATHNKGIPMTKGKSIQPKTNSHSRQAQPAAAAIAQHFGREQLITEAAYYRAKSRGFAPGHELEDWLSSESEVDSQRRGEGSAS